MTDICPTITADSTESYQEQMERVLAFTRRVHIDLSDGTFAPNKLLGIDEVWWPGGMRADLHVMYKNPIRYLEELIALGPQLIIVHAEADGDFLTFARQVHSHGIEVGVALLPKTKPSSITSGLEFIDHVLIFSGNLGFQGGSATDFQLLEKVSAIKALKPTIEVGWDGGVNNNNIAQLMQGGIEVVNVGGFIQNSPDPEKSFELLKSLV